MRKPIERVRVVAGDLLCVADSLSTLRRAQWKRLRVLLSRRDREQVAELVRACGVNLSR